MLEAPSSLIQACAETIRLQGFVNAYRNTFDIVPARTPEQKERCYRLRWEVFCQENRILDPADYPSGMETDDYDGAALHFLLIHKDSGDAAGTVRLVLPSEDRPEHSLPLQHWCDHPLLHGSDRIFKLAEVSRLCMAKRFRQRPLDGHMLPAYYGQDTVELPASGLAAARKIRRQIPYAPLGLLEAAFEAALEARIMDCVMLVESDHLSALSQIGMAYRVLGPSLRGALALQPLVFNIKSAFDNMQSERPECWDVATDRGRLHKMANQLHQNDWTDQLLDEVCRDAIYRKLEV